MALQEFDKFQSLFPRRILPAVRNPLIRNRLPTNEFHDQDMICGQNHKIKCLLLYQRPPICPLTTVRVAFGFPAFIS